MPLNNYPLRVLIFSWFLNGCTHCNSNEMQVDKGYEMKSYDLSELYDRYEFGEADAFNSLEMLNDSQFAFVDARNTDGDLKLENYLIVWNYVKGEIDNEYSLDSLVHEYIGNVISYAASKHGYKSLYAYILECDFRTGVVQPIPDDIQLFITEYYENCRVNIDFTFDDGLFKFLFNLDYPTSSMCDSSLVDSISFYFVLDKNLERSRDSDMLFTKFPFPNGVQYMDIVHMYDDSGFVNIYTNYGKVVIDKEHLSSDLKDRCDYTIYSECSLSHLPRGKIDINKEFSLNDFWWNNNGYFGLSGMNDSTLKLIDFNQGYLMEQQVVNAVGIRNVELRTLFGSIYLFVEDTELRRKLLVFNRE